MILRGEYGPRWWEVAPAFLAALVALGLPMFTIGWLWVRLGWWAALLAGAVLAYGVRAVVLRRREVAARNRRRA
ncbi:hypothetical protein G3I37_14955, partial [Streptomyces anulatus]|nr:hypothetical protein [Streptomyces anulatus]